MGWPNKVNWGLVAYWLGFIVLGLVWAGFGGNVGWGKLLVHSNSFPLWVVDDGPLGCLADVGFKPFVIPCMATTLKHNTFLSNVITDKNCISLGLN